MKKIWIVLEYELKEYLHNKSFVTLTLILSLLGFLGLFAPRILDLSSLTGVGEIEETAEEVTAERSTYYYYDEQNHLNPEILQQYLPDYDWILADSAAQIEALVAQRECEAGFVITSDSSYDYYVYNMDLSGSGNHLNTMFREAMSTSLRYAYYQDHDINVAELEEILYTDIQVNEQILGKDSESNYFYSYMLVIVVFMLIVFYGQMIAVSVTTEKSNRAIEVLVTTTTPNSLLFGKVIAGAVAGLAQVGLIMASILISYQMNRAQWGGILDIFLQIPGEVILTFALFGIGGYLFYAFLYGAVGALVSKTEDISKSSGGLMVLVMAAYFLTLIQMYNPEGVMLRVLSILPFSSFSAMFVRIALADVPIAEIALSFMLLLASIVGAGIIGAKIYRMGTLRYGNPISFRAALKDIKKQDS